MAGSIKMLQYPPTGLSQPHKQLGTFRNPFERDFRCNAFISNIDSINLSVCINRRII